MPSFSQTVSQIKFLKWGFCWWEDTYKSLFCEIHPSSGLLNSPSLVALWLSVGYGLWLVDLNITCTELQIPCNVWTHCEPLEFLPFIKSHWQSPCTVLMAGISLPLGLCKEIVKESISSCILSNSWICGWTRTAGNEWTCVPSRSWNVNSCIITSFPYFSTSDMATSQFGWCWAKSLKNSMPGNHRFIPSDLSHPIADPRTWGVPQPCSQPVMLQLLRGLKSLPEKKWSW